MNKHEYRFWDLINKCWTTLEGKILPKLDQYDHAIFCFTTDDNRNTIEISQWIGKVDINKKKIFVGDWVEDQNDKELFLIMYNTTKIFARRFYINVKCNCEKCIEGDLDTSKRCYTYEDLDLNNAIYNVLVVGNVFENEHLYEEHGDR